MRTLVLLFFAAGIAMSTAQAQSNFSFEGFFQTDDQVQLINFTLASDATVTFQTYGYGGGTNAAATVIPAGGFQSELSWFAADGTLFGSANSGCGAAGTGNSGFCLDTFVRPFLSAGTYTLAVTQAGNDPVGTLSDGFSEQGLGNFTASGSCTAFCGAFGDQDNGSWAVDILNVSEAAEPGAVPEPVTFLLTASGLSLIGLAARRRLN
ncbi:MAG TPA: DVUA0089 family protein [Bryobacteraceae bacterium]|jgi:hypothetical protein|nr:DVUA0089 family protein [Bryobacteraceae bacterium]